MKRSPTNNQHEPRHQSIDHAGRDRRRDLNLGAAVYPLSLDRRPSRLDHTIALMEPSEQRAIFNSRLGE